MVLDLLDHTEGGRVLEVGVGSGILLKELLARSHSVAAIDVYENYDGVQRMLKEEGINLERLELRKGNILNIPYESDSFDAAVCVSVLEHIIDPRLALVELRRVVRPGNSIVVGFPARTLLTDSLFRLLGYDPISLHPTSHISILNALHDTMVVLDIDVFPNRIFPMYFAAKFIENNDLT